MAEEHIGSVDHYFAHVGVAGIVLTGGLKVGDRIQIRGHTTDFELTVESIQIEHERISEASAGASVGLKVPQRCREGDQVYRLS